MNKKHDEDVELLIDLLIGALQEEGYEVFRFKDSKKHYTTAYDVLEIKRNDGVYFNITIDKRESFHDWIRKKYHKDSDTFESLKVEKELEVLNERD